MSIDRGAAILDEVMPTVERGALQSSVVAHSGCRAYRVDTYATVMIFQDLSFCPGPVQPSFDGARIASLRLVFP